MDGERQTDPLIGAHWSSDTLKVLSSMPSRTIGESCCENNDDITVQDEHDSLAVFVVAWSFNG